VADLTNIPLRAPNLKEPTTLDSVVKVHNVESPTEVDHYQVQRITDLYVTPKGEDLGKVAGEVQNAVQQLKVPGNVRINLRGMVQGMYSSFRSFAIGLSLSVVLLYLILVPQFRSFKDPLLYYARSSNGLHRGTRNSASDWHNPQRDVANGRVDAGRHLGVE